MHQDKDFILHLFDVLVRFRWNPVAISADIEKAFLMVGVDPNDRDMLCFLWPEDPERLNSKIRHLRFCRLVFGLRPSPAILGATIYQHLNSYQDQYPALIKLIRKSLYVDNLLSGGSSDSHTFEIYKQSKEIMSEGGFNLRKWNTNSPVLQESINKCKIHQDSPTQSEKKVTIEDESYIKSTTGRNNLSNEKSVKVLGSNWNTHSDELFFDFEDLITYTKSLPITKQALLKLSAKIFDPLGFLSPFTIRLKVMFQILCCEKIDWDEELHGDSHDMFNSFVTDLQHLSNVMVPRYAILM